MIEMGRVIVSAVTIIQREDNRILTIWEGDVPYHGYWVLPGGYVNSNETVEQAAIREVREEVGLEVDIEELIGVYDDFIDDERGDRIHHVIICYKAKIIGGEVTTTYEATEYAYIDPKEASTLTRLPDIFRRILTDLHNSRKRDKIKLW